MTTRKERMDTFRKEYKPLNDEQKALMLEIKEQAEKLETLFGQIGGNQTIDVSTGRLVSLAKTNLEQSIMWAVKAVTA